MMRGLSISQRRPSLRVQAASARWIAAALAMTLAAWLAALAILLAIANRVHDDVPVLLAIKLPLLQSRPELIFAGESRTVYQVDPNLAARLIGKPPGTVINIAYDAGEPLALLSAIRRQPDRFQQAHVVVSVAPFLFNEGVRSAAVYPQDVAARLGVVEQMRSFLPLRLGTLIRFIREAFGARLAADQHVADLGPAPTALGLNIIDRTQPDDRARDPAWRDKDDQYAALVADAGRRCGFAVINIRSIPGLGQGNYADEMHVNASGVPIYTSYLVSRLKR